MLRKESDDNKQVVVDIGTDYTKADLSTQDRAMLAFAEMLTFHHTDVSQHDIQGLRDEGFSDENILDIIGSVAYRNFSNRLNIAIGLDEGITEGDGELLAIAHAGR